MVGRHFSWLGGSPARLLDDSRSHSSSVGHLVQDLTPREAGRDRIDPQCIFGSIDCAATTYGTAKHDAFRTVVGNSPDIFRVNRVFRALRRRMVSGIGFARHGRRSQWRSVL